EVDDRNVRRGNADGNAVQLALKFGKNQTDCLGCTGRGRDHRHGSSASAVKVLVHGVERRLVTCISVNRRHEALLDAESIVQNLCNRRKAVGGAGSIRQNDVLAADLVMVHAIDHRQVGPISRSGDEDALRTTLKVSGSLLLGGEDARALQHNINAKIAPGKVGRIALSKRLEGVRPNTDRIALDQNFAGETTVNAVIA